MYIGLGLVLVLELGVMVRVRVRVMVRVRDAQGTKRLGTKRLQNVWKPFTSDWGRFEIR